MCAFFLCVCIFTLAHQRIYTRAQKRSMLTYLTSFKHTPQHFAHSIQTFLCAVVDFFSFLSSRLLSLTQCLLFTSLSLKHMHSHIHSNHRSWSSLETNFPTLALSMLCLTLLTAVEALWAVGGT